MSGAKNEITKIGFTQILIAILLVCGFAYIMQFELVPRGAAGFVVPLFQPSADEKEDHEKFKHIESEGLVWASVKDASNINIGKDNIDEKYIFDFTYAERKKDRDGYSKTTSEFYVKAPHLGEEPIFIEPYLAFFIIALVFGVVMMMFITMMMPASLGIMSALFEEQIHHTKTKIRLQSGFSDEIVEVLTLPDNELSSVDRDRLESNFRIVWNRTVTETEKNSDHKVMFDDVWDEDTDVVFFRNIALYQRLKEFFSEFLETEVSDCRDGRVWAKNKLLVGKGLRLYMAHHFAHKYANNVTGAAYGGAAFLIIAVGIRGLKFIPAVRPSFIFLAIFLEFTMLSLMAVTLFYTEEEERTDKMLKRMEDANRSQLEALKSQQEDIHKMSNALVGQNSEVIRQKVEATISEYLTSGDQVNKQIAEAIASKLVFDISSKK